MLLQFAQPFVIGLLIDGITSPESISMRDGLLLALALGLMSFASSWCIAAAFFNSRQLGLQVRTATMMAVFEKALTLTASARLESSMGNVTNLMAIDAEKLFIAAQFLNFIWHGPCAFLLSLVAIYAEVGPSALAGFGCLALILPLQKRLSLAIGAARRRTSAASDRRVQRMAEVLSGIRCLKLLAWEPFMAAAVESDRAVELKYVRTYHIYNGLLREVMFMAGPVTAVITFMVYVFVAGGNLTMQKMFRCLAFINILRFPMNLLGQAMKMSFDARVSVKRIEKFLARDSLPNEDTSAEAKAKAAAQGGSIVVDRGTFAWGGGSGMGGSGGIGGSGGGKDGSMGGTGGGTGGGKGGVELTARAALPAVLPAAPPAAPPSVLRDVSLRFERSDLVAVVGAVGSGKTALLGALLGELTMLSGRAVVRGRKAYMAQQPWIQNLTLRDNVLFGRDAREAEADGSLAAALGGSCLLPDLATLPGHDQCEIGEKGFNLSGGQKARVAFARCLCHAASADVFLLDDPFAAVDSATGTDLAS